jgi:anaerobic selenocysteine-containing dehydrogenase
MDTLLIICTSLLLTSTNHYCDNVLPKFFLYEDDGECP